MPVFSVPDMSCGHCVNAITRAIADLREEGLVIVLENGRVNLKKYGINVEEMLAQRELEHN